MYLDGHSGVQSSMYLAVYVTVPSSVYLAVYMIVPSSVYLKVWSVHVCWFLKDLSLKKVKRSGTLL